MLKWNQNKKSEFENGETETTIKQNPTSANEARRPIYHSHNETIHQILQPPSDKEAERDDHSNDGHGRRRSRTRQRWWPWRWECRVQLNRLSTHLTYLRRIMKETKPKFNNPPKTDTKKLTRKDDTDTQSCFRIFRTCGEEHDLAWSESNAKTSGVTFWWIVDNIFL